jgi:8-oxo-dGTP diphosphatase
MRARSQAVEMVSRRHREYLPHLSIDCVIFGFHAGELKVLLLRWKHVGGWSLPGGYIGREESLEDAAQRVLAERTGLKEVYLQQFGAFGGLNRREAETIGAFMQGLGVDVPDDYSFGARVVTIGYFALVDFEKATPTPDIFAEDCRWWDFHERPPLLFDHDEIVTKALETLRQQLDYQPLGPNLLPEKFTMPELQKLYETVLGRELDRRNFQRKVQDLGLVERLPERRTGGAHRAPYLYRFDVERWEQRVHAGR